MMRPGAFTARVPKESVGGVSLNESVLALNLGDDVVGNFDDQTALLERGEFTSHIPSSNIDHKLLNKYYQIVKNQLLKHQSYTIGLFKHDTADPSSRMADVRESIYCAITCWALSLSYRHIDSDGGRTYELQQSAVKAMRGILFCWMRQYDQLEEFKNNQCAQNALHTVFDMITGNPIHEHTEYHHLQIDIQSLYLLTLVQFTSSGLQVIYTVDEVNYIQNLVYYIERSYRVTDFGCWGRGTKYNNGTTELHASAIGMAKAALEAINGFNMFGEKGTPSSVIYVDIDAHNRNRTIFNTLLPRESSSKNTDMSLLFSLGFPAFAVDTPELRQAAECKVERKLKGNYGLKRFLRDGYGTVLEDKSRTYYQSAELKNFDGIECQWPLGFVLLIINSIFEGDTEKAEKYDELLDMLVVSDIHGRDTLPKYYYVTNEDLEEERRSPNSASRSHSGEGLGQQIKYYMMGQALYILSRLLVDKLVTPEELDPIGRRRGAGMGLKSNYSLRYSQFQIKPQELSIQVCIMAESVRLQSLLTTYGILSQTPHQIEPIRIWSPAQLVQAYEFLGRNNRLGLSGRPNRPLGGLSTSKIYRIQGHTIVSYPLVFEQSDFYIAQDMSMLIDDIKQLVRFVFDSWCVAGRPLFCCVLREEHFRDQASVSELLELLTSFKRGICSGVPVRLGRLQTMITSSCVEHLDFLSSSDFADNDAETIDFESMKSVHLAGSLPDPVVIESVSDEVDTSCFNIKEYMNMSTEQIVAKIEKSNEQWHLQSELLGILLNREGPEFPTEAGKVADRLAKMSHDAGLQRCWSVVRYCSGLLRKTVDSLAPSVTGILVLGRFLTIGVFGHEEELIVSPLTPGQIKDMVYATCLQHDPREAVLQQEVLISVHKLVTLYPDLFKGMLKIRIGWLIEAMKNEVMKQKTTSNFYSLSPSEMKDLLQSVLQTDVCQRSWAEQRLLDGSLNRSPYKFYDKVWKVLERCPGGIQIGSFHIPQQPTLSDMTIYDLNFSMLVEQQLCSVKQPSYRQIIVEMLMVIHTVFHRNAELKCSEVLNLDKLMNRAVRYFAKDATQSPEQSREEEELHGLHVDEEYMTGADSVISSSNASCEELDVQAPQAWFLKFYNTAPHVVNGTVKYMLQAVMQQLLSSDLDLPGTHHQCQVQ